MIKNRLILVGKAASGKDHLKNILVSRGFEREVSYTTRPPRPNEVDGVDYHFVTEEVFLHMKKEGLFYESQCFNGWWYGTTISEWEEKNVFIFTPSGVKDIRPEDRNRCTIIYLDIPESIRLERLMDRMDADKADRRIAADEKDFAGFFDYDIKISTPYF
jgi:guanylate kinase